MIDVLLPFRGDADLMRAAVDSVLAQDVDDWRLHVFDDADPDPSVSAGIEALGDPRISVTRAEERHGVNRAFRQCLTLGSEDLVTFMGCDDLMRPDHLRTCLDLAERFPGASMVQPGVQVIDDHGRPCRPLGDRVKARLRPGGERVLGGEPLTASLLHGNWLYFPSIVWRREALDRFGFRPGLDTVLDLQLVLDQLLAGEQLAITDHVTFDYRRHAASASSRTARSAERFTEAQSLYRETARRCEERGWRRAARAARLRLTTRLHAALTAGEAVRQRDFGAALHLGRSALEPAD